jgi:hypothetical protein
MSVPGFTKTVIGELENAVGGSQMNTLFTVGDINRDGRPDIVVSGRNGRMAWFENPGRGGAWQRHLVGEIENLECGGLVYDLTGSGHPDIINGSDYRADALYWWENPGPGGSSWTRHVITRTGRPQFHDELIGDLTGDGRMSLLFWNNGGKTLYWAPLPDDPRRTPWPDIRVIATGREENGHAEEGLAIADLDGDGRNEIVAGTHWYKYTGRPGEEWETHKFAADYISTVVAVGDINGDGRKEILLSEGDACIYGKPQGGKLAWFSPKDDLREPWEEHLIEDALLDPHSLQLGDLCGNGRLDILVGEIGVKDRYTESPPRLMVYENDSRGHFTRHVIDEGTGTHHARLVDLRGTGVLDIASRPLHGPEKWNVIVWYNDRGR